jgi:hypothetical protein
LFSIYFMHNYHIWFTFFWIHLKCYFIFMCMNSCNIVLFVYFSLYTQYLKAFKSNYWPLCLEQFPTHHDPKLGGGTIFHPIIYPMIPHKVPNQISLRFPFSKTSKLWILPFCIQIESSFSQICSLETFFF